MVYVYDVTNEILSRDSNCNVDMIMRPKVGNSSISMTETSLPVLKMCSNSSLPPKLNVLQDPLLSSTIWAIKVFHVSRRAGKRQSGWVSIRVKEVASPHQLIGCFGLSPLIQLIHFPKFMRFFQRKISKRKKLKLNTFLNRLLQLTKNYW